jgi:hypothetical protein
MPFAILENLKKIKDLRRTCCVTYELHYILFFSILAILARAQTYSDIARFIDVHFNKIKNIFCLNWMRPPNISTIWKIFEKIDIPIQDEIQTGGF